MPEYRNVAVIGSGSWGTAVGNVIADSGREVTIWGRNPSVLEINETHENKKYLSGIPLSKSLRASTDLESTIVQGDIVVCSIPTQQIRRVFGPVAGLLKSKIVVNTSKGIEEGTHATVSEIFAELSPPSPFVVLSGPSFALEVAHRLPTAVTTAAREMKWATAVQHMMSNAYFRVYTSKDVMGVELGGALKNVIAIASGVVVGLKLGYNAQAALINRGIAEMIRMGKKKGAEPLTFLGLSGMGDLILTCTGPLSRNRNLGVGLGEGKKLEAIQKELGGIAEGVYTSRSAYELAKYLKIEMPITEQVYCVLHEGSSPQVALKELMSRDLKEEWEIG